MRSAMKKLFSLMLVAVLLVSVMPFQASAASTYYQVYWEAGDEYVDSGYLTAGESYDPAALVPEGYTFVSAQHYWAVGGNGPIEAGNAYEVGDGDHFMIWVNAVPAHEHNYVGEVTTDPTCTEEGVKTFTCSCGEGTYTEPVDALGHNYENGKCSRCGVCEDCGNVNCTCTATVEIRIHVAGTEGNTADKQFKIPVGVKTAKEICQAANYTDNQILSFSVTDGDGSNPIVREETKELVAGGFYYLWLEVAPAAKPVVSPASVNVLAKEPEAEGYTDVKTFTIPAGSQSVTDIFKKAAYSGTVLSYSITAEDGSNKRIPGDDIELTAGGSYILWLEVAPATKPVVSPASVNVLAKEPEAEGYTDIKTFTMPAGSQSVEGIFDKAAYSGTVLSYCITAEDGSNKRIPGDDIELTAGGSYILWLEVAPATQPAPDQNVAKYDVRVNLNYDRKMGDTIEDVAKGTRMSEVLEHVNTPYRWGYKFAGWYWDDDCRDRDAVKLSDKVTKDCTIYAKWVKKHAHNEVMLKVYINGDTHNVAKIVDLHEYAKDGWISKDEVKAVVKKYYTAKDSDGLTFYGLFDAENWKSFVRNKNHDGSKHIEVNQGYDTTVYVMVHNAKTYATSSSTADATNPKTGDTIGMAITMMAVSAAALAAVYVTSKKRAV